MSAHTPEPWEVLPRESRLISIAGNEASNRIIAHIRFPEDKANEWKVLTTEDQANAQRIVACVNACTGIATELLDGATLERAADRIVSQRDELAAALRDLVEVCEIAVSWGMITDRPDRNGPLPRARAVLAMVKP